MITLTGSFPHTVANGIIGLFRRMSIRGLCMFIVMVNFGTKVTIEPVHLAERWKVFALARTAIVDGIGTGCWMN